MVGLRAAEAGLALLGLLRHRSRRLAGNGPWFLGRSATSGGHGPESDGQDQPGDQDQAVLGSGHRQVRPGGYGRFGGRSDFLAESRRHDRHVDHHDRHVTGRHVGAFTDGRALGPEGHTDRSDGQHDRHASVGVGDGLYGFDRSDTLGHLEHGGHSMTDQSVTAVVQICGGRDLQLRREFIGGLWTGCAVE